ncbi:sigma-54 dependent transcriptional regulator [Blastopirellula sp. J2-11]|uniref:sigma-54-dependent transcriptional regulator n=1 Tax=Blastopirellula sp. J2-11 TaxID=2943192 RepID=UPI0021C95381|nr:sigma-54 dependent transcriptional regulator [Blastopirellula sp. J2-11]UUO07656.1 sigma-54 dependent transcriptional regulator [Blastopirellula sp. J2-11]
MSIVESPIATGNVLVVDDNARARQSIVDVLEMLGHRGAACSSAHEALKRMETIDYDAVVTDLQMPGMDGLELVQQIRRRDAHIPIVMVTAHGSVSTAVEAMRFGAADYLEKPLNADRLEAVINRVLESAASGDRATVATPGETNQVAMIGESRLMQQVRQQIAQVAPTDETVLIIGESGVGKELVARTIHQWSRRADRALISLNCPVLSAHLMESELFGHTRGAFTSADSARVGRFELAEQGTILLDEISEIDLSLQAKLLRVLQERCYERVGSSETLETDVRVLATSNRDLPGEVTAGRFRRDLYYRLAVVPIELPPLRQRRDDIPLLVEYFLHQTAARLEKPVFDMQAEALDLLVRHDWPGNVRELENIVTRACVLAIDGQISADAFSSWLNCESREEACDSQESQVGVKLDEMERRLISATLEHYDGHREKTAAALGISPRTLSNKLRSYGLAPRAKTFARAI